ncbi:MAG: hypothetical protein M3Q07_22030, partial [Pseudobdellovibrionaceae bacterium]|nr:hypothetical protein [Pseudobdellovibrionaceae bacterium]
MIITKASVGLSITVIIALVACQADVVQDSRRVTVGATTQPASKEDDAKPGETKVETPAANTGKPAGNAPAPATYTMTWDVSADPAIVSYKVFVVPPDRNPRFPGKTD